jgi:hypothetical protein
VQCGESSGYSWCQGLYSGMGKAKSKGAKFAAVKKIISKKTIKK